jgi:DNA repair protein RadD
MELYDYQQHAMDLLRQALAQGYKRPLVGACCAFGKTVLASEIMRLAVKKGKRCIFIADRVKLIDQTIDTFIRNGLDIGVIQADHIMANGHKPVQVASIQTLARRKRMPEFDLAIVDECHVHYKTTQSLMDRYSAVPFIGLSATPYSKGLGLAYDKLLVPITTREMIERGQLTPLVYYGGKHVDTKGLKKKRLNTGVIDYDPAQLAEVSDKTELVGDVIENWKKYAYGRKTIAFTASIKQSEDLVEKFMQAGINAYHISGYTKPEDRKEIFEAHRRGDFEILSCSKLLTTGYDEPAISCIIDLQPTNSLILQIQKLGRGQRLYENKTDCVVLDHAGNTLHRHGFIEDYVPQTLDTGEKGYNEKAQTKKEKSEVKERECPECGGIMKLTCPCGFTLTKKQALETDSQTLQKIEHTRVQQERWLGELRLIALTKGYANGWVAHTFKKKFKKFPNGVKPAPAKTISDDVTGFIKHLAIRRSYANNKTN